MPLAKHAEMLEGLYQKYNRMEFVHPDPLEFPHRYTHPADREVVALIASCLAYGRVAQILRSVQRVLDELGPSPATALRNGRPAGWRPRFVSFRHRFATGE